ncbi:MAG: amidinotransferase, partial [bacterium]|nr:amidinotransferase [bacterium]
MLRNEGERLKRVIVSTPGDEYFNVENLKAHNITEIADRDLTIRQHGNLKRIMSNFGAEVIDVPELEGHPNSVFTRDALVCTPGGYIKLRMGLETRRGEDTWLAEKLNSLGEPFAGEIIEPGTVEGGDIILAGKVAFVGLSNRTNMEGIMQLTAILNDMDYEVRVHEIPNGSLHIGGFMSMVGPDRILCCKDKFPDGFFRGFDVIEVEWHGVSTGNVICLGDNEIIANASENIAVIH